MGNQYRFGAFELDGRTGELRKSGIRIKLGGQPLEVLTLLVERQGDLVTRAELKDALWKQESFTDFDHGVNTAVQRIRRVLGDSVQAPLFIETLPRKGYRFIAAVERVEPQREKRAPPRPSERRRAIAVLAAGLVASGYVLWPGSEPEPLAFTERAITFDPDLERRPELSPDGTRVAYQVGDPARAGSNPDIYVRLVEPDATKPLRVTSGPSVEVSPTWSPDGSKLAFFRLLKRRVRPEASRFELVVASPAENPREEILTEFAARGGQVEAAWSPDGRYIAFGCRPDGSAGWNHLCVYSFEASQHWAINDDYGNFSWPKVGPDGRAVIYRRAELNFQALSEDLHADEEARILAPGFLYPYPAGWSVDGTQAYFFGRSPEHQYGLWSVGLEPGASPRLVRTIEPPASTGGHFPSLRWTPSGQMRIVYGRRDREADIMLVDLSRDPPSPPVRLAQTSRADFNPQFSSDGERLAFISNRTGLDALWVSDLSGASQELVAEFWPFAGYSRPSWSPDGKRIAVDALHETDFRDVYVVDLASKRVGPSLTTSGGRMPAWTADAEWLYYTPSDTAAIRRLNVSSHETESFLDKLGQGPFAESFDEQTLYFLHGLELMQVALDKQGRPSGKPESIVGDVVSFGLAKTGVYAMTRTGAVVVFDPVLSKVRPVFEVPFEFHGLQSGMSVSPDGRWLAYTYWMSDETDLMLLETVP